MKLTEENRDKIHTTRNGNMSDGKTMYVYGGLCKNCGEPFIAVKGSVGGFCNRKCSTSGKYNPIYGTKHSVETRSKISKSRKGKCSGKENYMYGKTHTDEAKQKISDKMSGKNHRLFGKHQSCVTRLKISNKHIGLKHTQETKDKISNLRKGKGLGKDAPGWKGGVIKLGIPLYDTYAYQLAQFGFEEVRIYMVAVGGVVYKSLHIRCHESGCKKWFRPTIQQVRNRLEAFNGTTGGSNNFYCSEECKIMCSTFNQKIQFKDQNDIKRTYSTTELKEWSREVLRRNNFICACCGDNATIGHHKKSKIEFPELALDPNNGMALCKLCHMPIFHKGLNGPVHFVDKCR